MAEAYRDALAAVRLTGVTIVDLTTPAELGARLAAHCSVDPELVTEAIGGDPVSSARTNALARFGANRNAGLLYAAGAGCLSIDDDILIEPVAARDRQPGLRYSSAPRPFTHSFDAPPPIPTDVDLIATHERYLGRTPSEALAEASDALLGGLESGRTRIAAVVSGIHRDSGGAPGIAHLQLDESTRARLLAGGETAYRDRLASRIGTRVCEMATVGDSGYLITGAYSVDTTRLLPPFMPSGRGEDAVFGFTLRAMGSASAYLPVALAHRPVDARADAAGEHLRAATAMRMSSIVLRLLGELPPGEPDATATIGALASLHRDAQGSARLLSR